TDDTVEEVKVKMRENDFSQLPVSRSRTEIAHIGRITRDDLMDVSTPDSLVKELMGSKFLEIPYTLNKNAVKEILREDPAVLVLNQKEEPSGIITKSNII
ncbi:MAG: CBS domain-containing protein, partial [Candidatus Nanohaloarchaea archaeon]